MRFKEFKKMMESGDIEQVRSHLAFEMIADNSPKKERYRDCPHIQIKDMCAMPMVWAQIDDYPGSIAKVPFSKELCSHFSVGDQELLQIVQDETAKNMMPIRKLIAFMTEQFGAVPLQTEEDFLYLATTKNLQYGASVICTDDFFKQAAQQVGGDYYILPSSINEVILMKGGATMKPTELRQLVEEINANELDEVERLTDNAYHYDARKDLLETAEEYEARLKKEQTVKREQRYGRTRKQQPERDEPEEEEELER